MSEPKNKAAKKSYSKAGRKVLQVLNNLRHASLIIGVGFTLFGIHSIIYPDSVTTISNREIVTGLEAMKVHLTFIVVGVALVLLRFTILKNRFE